MSIFSRISRIIRANLQSGAEEDSPANESFYEEYLRKKQAKADSDSHHSRETRSEHEKSQSQVNNGQQDPQIAQYYANLEVPYGSDLETVRRAWKQLLRQYHPDLHSGDPKKQEIANKLVQGLNHAYKELEKRLSG